MAGININWTILSDIKLPNTETSNGHLARDFNNKLFEQIILEKQGIIKEIGVFNKRVQNLRTRYNKPFAFNKLKGLPNITNFPNTLDITNTLFFLNK